jgi:hypothetical protein
MGRSALSALTRAALCIAGLTLWLLAVPDLTDATRVGAALQLHPVRHRWVPPGTNVPWQWELDHPLNLSNPADMGTGVTTFTGAPAPDPIVYDIDGFDNSAATVKSLHARGFHVICYIDVGTWENWRPDASRFPASVLGAGNGWPGERWLDIRRLAVLKPIMTARLEMCRQKGFDAVEPDNLDSYENHSGFPINANEQLTYNRWIAAGAHSLGLSVALKNDPDQAAELEPDFDFAIDEQCFQYQACTEIYPVFHGAGKAVFEVEYSLSTARFCAQANAYDFNAMKMNIDLSGGRQPCR